MFRLPEIWKEAGRRGTKAPDSARTQLLTDADLDLDSEELDANDPETPEFIRERLKDRQYQEQVANELDHHQLQAAQASKQQDEDDRRRRDLIASEQYRREYQALCDDIADAKTAAQEAYEQALKRQHDAEEALEKAHRNALVVAGDRVYFARDGQSLYGEDGSEISDRETIAAARSEQIRHPEATTYEDQRDKVRAQQETARGADQLRTVSGKLDQLDDRIKNGSLSREDLALAQQEKQSLIDELPEEARERYERLHAARQSPENAVATRTIDSDFSAVLNLDSHFEKAGAAVAAPVTPREEVRIFQPGDQPAYRTPDFGS